MMEGIAAVIVAVATLLTSVTGWFKAHQAARSAQAAAESVKPNGLGTVSQMLELAISNQDLLARRVDLQHEKCLFYHPPDGGSPQKIHVVYEPQERNPE